MTSPQEYTQGIRQPINAIATRDSRSYALNTRKAVTWRSKIRPTHRAGSFPCIDTTVRPLQLLYTNKHNLTNSISNSIEFFYYNVVCVISDQNYESESQQFPTVTCRAAKILAIACPYVSWQ